MDVGNTNIVCAVIANGEIVSQYRIPSLASTTADDFHEILVSALGTDSISELQHVVLGSVVPAIGKTLAAMFEEYTQAQVTIIDGMSQLGMRINTANPQRVGADLVANAYAVWQKYRQNTIVVDLGTATTIQLVTAEGVYQGVAIAPGLKTAALNLFDNTAQLDEVALESPKSVIGDNTIDAMRSGIVLGHALMIDGFIDRINQEYPALKPIKTILTGGLAGLMQGLVRHEITIVPELTLEGLYLALLKCIEVEALA
jgi:type III pantothenate kinase